MGNCGIERVVLDSHEGNFSARGNAVSVRGKDRAHARASDVASDFGIWRAAQACFLCLAKSMG
jgi:hypothetical protein